ncbi:MAG: oligoendopeptidase F [Eubacteriales bacterium]|nr:oligoendopeptidase F [Eubacteriales bacterium]
MKANKNGALPSRDSIDKAYKWKLEDLYASDKLWEEGFNEVRKMISDIEKYHGKLAADSATLVACQRDTEELMSKAETVFAYARMRRDEDNGNATFQAYTDRAMALLTEASAAISFIVPEIVAMDEAVLNKFLAENKELEPYKHFIASNLRMKAHILTGREEQILALAGEMAEASSEIYSMYNNADIRFPYIKDENGKKVELTKGRYIKFMESTNREVRKDAFTALYKTYAGVQNTMASTLSNNVKKDKFFSEIRKYNSSMEASLDSDNISPDVYNNLIDTVDKNMKLLHRYVDLRKKILKLDELHMYDLYVPLVEEPETDIPYEKALEMIKKGLEPLGEKYVSDIGNAFESGWIDVFENRGKTSGAYSWGNYMSHPFILLNYQGTLDDVFTIAHEGGHAMHSFYTNKKQRYINSHYTIFLAEVASTVNESLLVEYMLKNTTDKKKKAYLLNHRLESFRGTLYRQTMFAEFEKIIHGRAGKGGALTAEELNRTYHDLNKKYYGKGMLVDEDIMHEWSRIPHFYTSFYVYKYATGISAATSLATRMLAEGKPAVDKYLEFLASGCSEYSLELLKKAGVDLTTPKPVQDALNVFEATLNEMEKII